MHGGNRIASRHWKQIEKQRGTAMNNHRDDNGVSWVCIVGVTGLLLGTLLLTRPLGDRAAGVEWYQKKRPVAVAAKPKPKQTRVRVVRPRLDPNPNPKRVRPGNKKKSLFPATPAGKPKARPLLSSVALTPVPSVTRLA